MLRVLRWSRLLRLRLGSGRLGLGSLRRRGCLRLHSVHLVLVWMARWSLLRGERIHAACQTTGGGQLLFFGSFNRCIDRSR